MIAQLVRLVVGVALVVAPTAGAVALAPVAAAATCSGPGVSVVVDFNQLGGGVTSGCDGDGGGRPASEVFPGAGYPLTYVQTQPGFVCRVSGEPASTSCARTPPADAFWSLWWTDGTSGQWTYANEGVASLDVPSGGSLAFSWQQGGARTPPSLAAPTRSSGGATSSPSPTRAPTKAPTKSPTKAPTKSPTKAPTKAPTKSPTTAPTPNPGGGTGGANSGRSSGGAATGTTGATGGTGDGEDQRRRGSAPDGDRNGTPDRGPSESPDESPTESPSATTDASEAIEPPLPSDDADPGDPRVSTQEASADGDGGVPGYVLALVVLMLAGAAAAVALVRRSRAGT
ncbi:hypothetical protein KLP28_01615 [Nocardioidaceae bacterium]|nr:hypothetical protein KLP28_01615 [Nocardioidaceae bacterium]